MVPVDATVRELPDAELVRRVARQPASASRAAAEAELCRRFEPRIRLYGLKHLRTEEHARELVQIVLLGVLEALRAQRVEEPEHLARYVLGTCRHLADRIRRQESRTEPAAAGDLLLVAAPPDTDALDFGAIIRCIMRLEPRARTVLHLTFTRERSAEEIAAVVATTAGNVRVMRCRALDQVRRCIERGAEASR